MTDERLAQDPKLTARQQQILDLIETAIARTGAPPTRAEIASELGFKSANAAEEQALIDSEGANIRAIVTNATYGAPGALLAQLPALEMIAVFSAGYEGLDVAGARARGPEPSLPGCRPDRSGRTSGFGGAPETGQWG